MPRKPKYTFWDEAFYWNDRKRVVYLEKCRSCIKDCKQSWRVIEMHCPKYEKKTASNLRA